MQFTCEQERLSRMLNVVNRAVAKGAGAFPMATNIRLSSEENRIRLDATNLSIGITGWVEATNVQTGVVAIPARLFTDLISALSPGKIEITVDDAYDVVVKGASGTVHIRGIDASEFPKMPSPDGDNPTVLKSALLKEVIREVAIAVDESGAREVFTNILMQMEEQHLTFAAADGYGKLAFRTLPQTSTYTCDLLVPARSLIDLAAILPTDEMVELRKSESQIIFSTPSLVLSSILSSGKFPNYKAALPKEKQTRVTVKTHDLREIVRLTALFAKADHDAGRITITGSTGVEPGTLTIASEAADVGGNCNTISVVVEGDDQNLVFNVANLTKVLSVINSPELVFEVGVTKAPIGVMRPAGSHTCIHSFSSMNNAA